MATERKSEVVGNTRQSSYRVSFVCIVDIALFEMLHEKISSKHHIWKLCGSQSPICKSKFGVCFSKDRYLWATIETSIIILPSLQEYYSRMKLTLRIKLCTFVPLKTSFKSFFSTPTGSTISNARPSAVHLIQSKYFPESKAFISFSYSFNCKNSKVSNWNWPEEQYFLDDRFCLTFSGNFTAGLLWGWELLSLMVIWPSLWSIEWCKAIFTFQLILINVCLHAPYEFFFWELPRLFVLGYFYICPSGLRNVKIICFPPEKRGIVQVVIASAAPYIMSSFQRIFMHYAIICLLLLIF